jgi:membrane dipeptidase
MFIFDAHLDLSLNAMEGNRDLTRPLGEIRQREQGLTDKPDRGNGTVSLPAMRRGRVGLCVATQIARFVKPGNPLPGWKSPAQAWAHTQGQLAWYRAMEDAGQMVQIRDAASLHRHVQLWQGDPPPDAPIGYILSLEGGDSIVTLKHLERAYAQGLRAVGPAHYGPGTYAYGTDATDMIPGAKTGIAPGADARRGLGPRGRELLAEMERLGIILDTTHLSDQSFWEALDHFGGPVWASHSNCRALVPHHRQFSDEQIKALIARGAVIGGCLDAWMLVPGWIAGQSTPQSAGVQLRHLVDHIDHICQLAGNARHCGLGTDLDGEFGREQSPGDLDSIADLQNLPGLFAARGYPPGDIAAIMHGNFLRFLTGAWR